MSTSRPGRPLPPLRRLSAVVTLLAGLALVPVSPASAGLPVGDRGSGPTVRTPAGPQGWQRSQDSGGIAWSDVPRDHWARKAIDHVAGEDDWMRDYKPAADGTYAFQPETLESRKHFARAVVRAFAPEEPVDPSVTFPDLPSDDRFYAAANVAVKLGWMEASPDGFLPNQPVTTTMVHRALVLALGLSAEAAGLDALHTRNGVVFETPPDFGTLLLGMRLGLRYNHGDDAMDVGPASPLPRAEVAWSLYRAATASSWTLNELAPYATIELPILGPKKQRIVRFAVRYVGYPYVWGGEWDQPSPEGYCCGGQPVGGFDCSGLVWWALKAAESGWDNVPPRDYRGWSLPERSSADMASVGEEIPFEDIKAGDLLFQDGDEDGRVDHVNLYLGNGWALDSSSGYGGVSILSVRSGWYRDHFVHARRVIA